MEITIGQLVVQVLITAIITAPLTAATALLFARCVIWWDHHRRVKTLRTVAVNWDRKFAKNRVIDYSSLLRDAAYKSGDTDMLYHAGVLHCLGKMIETKWSFAVKPVIVKERFGEGPPLE